jgi:uncharacterized protein YkwD
MPDERRSSLSRRPRRLLLALVMTLAAVAAPPGAAAADDPVLEAELAMAIRINAERASAGLAPVRLDFHLAAIARTRSVDMATYHYFGHVQHDGRTLFDLLREASKPYELAGEVLAWSSQPAVDASLGYAIDAWLGSPGHRAIVLGGRYDAVGIGAAWDARDGRWYWTGVFVDGPAERGVTWVTGVAVRGGTGGAQPSTADERAAAGEAMAPAANPTSTLASEPDPTVEPVPRRPAAATPDGPPLTSPGRRQRGHGSALMAGGVGPRTSPRDPTPG